MIISIRSAIFSALLLGACSGGGATGDASTPDGAGPDGSLHDDASTRDASVDAEAGQPDADAPDADVPDADAPDAEVPDADVPDADVPPSSCTSVVGEATLCLGEASGRPGDRVPMTVHILLPPGCPHTTQVGATLTPSAPVGTFVARPLSECWAVTPSQTSAGFLYLTRSARPMCPPSLFAGELATVELDIGATTPPGEYTVELVNPHLGDNSADTSGGCRGDGAIAGRITVRP